MHDVKSHAQSGFVLVVCLLMLLVMSIIGVSMFRGSGLQEKMAGNIKEKGRALLLAQNALHHAESLLAQSSTVPLAQNSTCSAVLTAPTVCGNPVTITNTPVATLSNGYTDTTAANLGSANVSTSGGQGTYYAYPQFYVQYLGPSSNGQEQLYEITALGYGGNAAAVSIVESTYEVSSGVQNLGGL